MARLDKASTLGAFTSHISSSNRKFSPYFFKPVHLKGHSKRKKSTFVLPAKIKRENSSRQLDLNHKFVLEVVEERKGKSSCS